VLHRLELLERLPVQDVRAWRAGEDGDGDGLGGGGGDGERRRRAVVQVEGGAEQRAGEQ
jgi:hypothetical protein